MEELSKEITVEKIYAVADSARVEEYKISSVPTLILIEDGKEIDRHTGAMGYNDLRTFARV